MDLLSVALPLLEEGFYINLNWLGQVVRWIIEGVGIVGAGVVVFTLVLKLITTPFDVYQRVKMRKQSLIMRDMKDDLEKLQKQYANDKQTYSIKMMELQKKNGYSMFGACLPMIISFVILIVAISAFQSFSQYANLNMYEQMAHTYNAAILKYAPEGTDYRLSSKDENTPIVTWTWDYNEPHEDNGVVYTIFKGTDGINRMRVTSPEKSDFIYYEYNLDVDTVERSYFIDTDLLYTNQQDPAIKAALDELLSAEGATLESVSLAYVQDFGARAAAEWFRTENDPSFLWIKNVWYPDVSYAHPIQSYSDFTSSFSNRIIRADGTEAGIGDIFSEADYNSMTLHLGEEKEQPNGYFILIIITIGLMVLQQFIMMKSQKEANQYQTVDGQGAKTQKIMMVMMPLIYAITGLMWTAAFSIYIAMSSIIGILTTLISNFFIDRSFRKKEEKELIEKYQRKVPTAVKEAKERKQDNSKKDKTNKK